MAYRKEYLMIPGPTVIPSESSLAMGTPMFNHRGVKFAELIEEVTTKAKQIFQTQNDVFFLTGSGTGSMEAAVVNFLSPGDKVLSLVNGNFSTRITQIAEIYGAEIQRIDKEWGTPFDYEEVARILKDDVNGEIKAVLMIHNESSTGMMNDMAALSKARAGHPALLIVDTVSSMGAIDLPIDDWGIDVCFTGSQKALMSPPGIGLISVSKKAWKAAETAKMPNFYFDLNKYRDFLEKGQTPFTPAISQILSLRETMNLLIEQEGLVNVYDRHLRMRDATRAAMRGLGLELLIPDENASVTVTAVKKPAGIKIDDLRKYLRVKYGVIIAGGQGKLSDDMFRIGHMGATFELDIISTVCALEMALKHLGAAVNLGAGMRAAEEILVNNWK